MGQATGKNIQQEDCPLQPTHSVSISLGLADF